MLVGFIMGEVIVKFRNPRFRRRFRLPYDLFVTFVEECREVNLFKEKNYSKIPIEFKILMSLRIIGRDSCADDISEYINIGDSTVNHIFKLFLQGCVELLYNKYVYIPFGEELDKVKLVYEKLGLPGCIGSMDCTHILWHRCPKISRNICTGKEAKPTVAFQVISWSVGHLVLKESLHFRRKVLTRHILE